MAEPEHQDNIHDFPWLEEATGVKVNDLGCVMLPVMFPKNFIAFDPGVLYTAQDPEHFWIKGDVSGDAHVTVLYGLLTPAYEQEGIISRLVAESGWEAPKWLPIEGYELFPSPLPDEDYLCLVARIGDTPDGKLARLRSLLEYLPHVKTFAEVKMHATIAYLTPDAAQAFLNDLSSGHTGIVIVPPAVTLDLGSSH